MNWIYLLWIFQGHMTWDVTMPSFLGYVSGLLWNQNNVDSTASPVTTKFEVDVGQQLCQLMRFKSDDSITPWGHLTGCGSVANIEGMWAARNTKLHPLALRDSCADPDFKDLTGTFFKIEHLHTNLVRLSLLSLRKESETTSE